MRRGIYLTLDALISLIILFSFIAMIPHQDPNLDRAVIYKEASDVSQVIIVTRSTENPALAGKILDSVNKNLDLKIIDTGETTVRWRNKENRVVIIRPVFDDKLKRIKEVRFVFGY